MSTSQFGIQIRLIGNVNDESRDELISLYRKDGNVEVIHREPGPRGARRTILLTRTGVVDYIRTLIKMLRNDCDPYRSVQFGFPGFPDVLYIIARLHNPEVVKAIEDSARIVSDDWFSSVPAGLFDDASSVSTDTTDSTDSDMPPLIAATSRYYLRSRDTCCTENCD